MNKEAKIRTMMAMSQGSLMSAAHFLPDGGLFSVITAVDELDNMDNPFHSQHCLLGCILSFNRRFKLGQKFLTVFSRPNLIVIHHFQFIDSRCAFGNLRIWINGETE